MYTDLLDVVVKYIGQIRRKTGQKSEETPANTKMH